MVDASHSMPSWPKKPKHGSPVRTPTSRTTASNLDWESGHAGSRGLAVAERGPVTRRPASLAGPQHLHPSQRGWMWEGPTTLVHVRGCEADKVASDDARLTSHAGREDAEHVPNRCSLSLNPSSSKCSVVEVGHLEHHSSGEHRCFESLSWPRRSHACILQRDVRRSSRSMGANPALRCLVVRVVPNSRVFWEICARHWRSGVSTNRRRDRAFGRFHLLNSAAPSRSLTQLHACARIHSKTREQLRTVNPITFA